MLFITCYHVPTPAVPASVPSTAVLGSGPARTDTGASVQVYAEDQGCQWKFSGKPFVSMVIFVDESHAKTSTEMVWL